VDWCLVIILLRNEGSVCEVTPGLLEFFRYVELGGKRVRSVLESREWLGLFADEYRTAGLGVRFSVVFLKA